MTGGAISNVLTKALSPAFYKAQYDNFWIKMHNYYHPLFRAGSAKPLWHMMIFTSTVMYIGNYYAIGHRNVQEKRAIEKQAMKEYYEKHGGSPDHH